MKFYLYEKLKFVFLIMLVLLSLFQVGILWYYQNHGLPISFFEVVTSNAALNKDYDLKEFLKPSRIVISQGYDEPHLVLGPTDSQFDSMWREARSYLRDVVLENKIITQTAYNDDDWADLVVKKSILINFPTNIDAKLLKLFLEVDNSSNTEVAKFNKIVIALEDNINSEITVYMTDGKKICKYSTRPHLKSESSNDFSKVNFSDQNPSYYAAKLLKEIFPREDNAPFIARPDIPVYVMEDKYVQYSNLKVTVPQILKADVKENRNLEHIAQSILGNDRGSYDADIGEAGSIILANVNNLYKLDTKGFLEYIYLGNQNDNSNTDINKAFEKAIDYISGKKSLIRMDSIYLCDINYDQKKDAYVFQFNYIINSIPVIFQGAQKGTYEPGIKIEADSSRVISAKMILRNTEFVDIKRTYDLNFTEFSKEMFSRFTTGKLKKMSIEDIYVGFYSANYINDEEIAPAWIVKTTDNKYYGLNLQEKR